MNLSNSTALETLSFCVNFLLIFLPYLCFGKSILQGGLGPPRCQNRRGFWNNSAPLAKSIKFSERTEFVLQYQKSKKYGLWPVQPPVWNGSQSYARLRSIRSCEKPGLFGARDRYPDSPSQHSLTLPAGLICQTEVGQKNKQKISQK